MNDELFMGLGDLAHVARVFLRLLIASVLGGLIGIERYREPGGLGVRVDSGFGEGDEIPRAYDSLVAKLISWGATREEARRRMLRALGEFRVEGIPTTIPAHRLLLQHPAFLDGSYTTRTVEEGALDSLIQTSGRSGRAEVGNGGSVVMIGGLAARLWNPAMAGSVSAAGRVRGSADSGAVVAPMHGTILEVLVSQGDAVKTGDLVAVIEAMKMETQVVATASGTVTSIDVTPGAVVEAGQAIAHVA